MEIAEEIVDALKDFKAWFDILTMNTSVSSKFQTL